MNNDIDDDVWGYWIIDWDKINSFDDLKRLIANSGMKYYGRYKTFEDVHDLIAIEKSIYPYEKKND